MKTCRVCETTKEDDAFYKSDTRRCRECVKVSVRENRAKNADYYRAYDRVRFYEGGHRGKPTKEAQARGARAWQSRNAHKRSAHLAVNNALRRGTLTRPLLCQTCQQQRPLQGHHDDYSKPLEVRWLCTPCHAAWHRKYDEKGSREIMEAKRSKTG